MSDVKTIREDLILKIQTALGSDVTVDKWAGEGSAISSATPSALVSYDGAIDGESVEIGRATFASEHIFHVIVQTADLPDYVADDAQPGDPAGLDGEDSAADILEAVRTALNEVEIAGLGVARPYKDPMLGGATVRLTKVHAGHYEYTQAWKIEQMNG